MCWEFATGRFITLTSFYMISYNEGALDSEFKVKILFPLSQLSQP